MADTDFSVDRLREILQYDPLTGAFTLRVDVSHIRKAGQRIDVEKHGKRSSGYKAVNLFGKRISAHRAAWAIANGRWPDEDIDHINGDRSDNRMSNLRLASKTMNMRNQRRAHASSKTKLMGVHKDGARFRAQITVNGRTVHIGMFDTPEEAHAAYLVKKSELHAIGI